jgi:hypothetical protein
MRVSPDATMHAFPSFLFKLVPVLDKVTLDMIVSRSPRARLTTITMHNATSTVVTSAIAVPQRSTGAVRNASVRPVRLQPRTVAAKASEDDPARLQAMQDAASNPELMKAVEERMQDPEVQQEMAAMNAMMSDPAMMQKVASLREDPDLAPMFEEIKTGGMAAMMKYMNDQVRS